MSLDEDRWLLPEGIEEVLPPDTWRLEALRRKLLDLYRCWGFDLVMPPFIDYLESLLVGTGHDLELQTFKLIDPLSGRLLGVRADMTPQVARIDAHQLRLRRASDIPSRLCYIGTVLQTHSDGFGGSRSPVQVGAELYGHAGIESDLEILALMLQTLRVAGVDDVHLDLGHVAIFRALVQKARLSAEQEAHLFEILQRKALPELAAQLERYNLAPALSRMFLNLAQLNGDENILAQAERDLAQAGDEVKSALRTLRQVSQGMRRRWPHLPIHCDLAELRGYRYHTGLVFSAYVPGQGQEVARGGRYDSVGQTFGQARPATGFSADLKTILILGNAPRSDDDAVFAPDSDDPALEALVEQLRTKGNRVIRALPGVAQNPRQLGCTHQLLKQGEAWTLSPLSERT